MRTQIPSIVAGGLIVLLASAGQAASVETVVPSRGVKVEAISPLSMAPGAGLPFALDDTSPTAAPSAPAGNEWVVAPVPFVNPLVGTGLAGGAAYIYHPPGEDKASPPWTTGVGGFFSDSKSWTVAVFHKMNMREDSWRISGASGYGHLNYDFYGIGDAASNGRLVSLSQTLAGVMAEGLFRVHEHFYAGLSYSLSRIVTRYAGDNLPPWINDIVSGNQLSTLLSVPGLRAQWDSRNDSFSPSRGSLIDGELTFSDEKFGSDYTFQTLSLTAKHYWKLSEQQTVAVYGFGQFVFGDVPFFKLSSIGSKGNLRGYAVGRYQDRMALTSQVEYRWQAWRRFGLVAFGGVGAVAPDWSGFSDATALPSVGGGVRYLLTEKNKVNFRVDVAWGRDERLIYVGVGEAF